MPVTQNKALQLSYNMGKVLLIVSIVITAATAAIGFFNRATLATTKQDLEETSATLSKTKETLAKSEAEVKSTTDKLSTATAEKEEISVQAENLKTELTKAKSEVTDLTTQISTKNQEIEKLTADLTTAQNELATAKANPSAEAPDAVSTLQMDLEGQKALVTDLQNKLDEARRKREELEREKQERMALKMRKGLEGTIEAVNQAWNFVVINIGDREGVINNAEMLVKRGTSLIGKVRVTSVEPKTSIADIVANSVPRGVMIQPGDHVIYQSTEE